MEKQSGLFILKNADYKYTVEELKEFTEKVENLVIINPDNPSGHFLSKNDLIELLEHMKNRNKYLILDESFVDFAEEEDRYSMIDSGILQKYQKLVVMKSISKSYGVPGLRVFWPAVISG